MRHHSLFGCLLLASAVTPAFAQVDILPLWQRTSEVILPEANPALQYVTRYETFRVDFPTLESGLHSVPIQGPGRILTGRVLEMPTPDGKIQHFKVAESPIMTDALGKTVQVKTYRVQGIEDPWACGRIDVGIRGFHGYVQSPNGDYLIDPKIDGNLSDYVAYYRRDDLRPRNEFICYTNTSLDGSVRTPGQEWAKMMSFGTLKTYRLALNATVEYSNTCGGTVPLAQAAMITSVNRVNQVYEKDLAIHMTLVTNNPYVGNVNGDPFTNSNGGTMLSQNQTVCDANPGNANYDIGHVFSTGGGGIAGLQVVGKTGQKARGVTGSPSPHGDGFDIDYVAHEMGHQYGANHTFNGTSGSCGGGNRSSSHAYEPGSGSTIMAYAGICGAEDLQAHSDAYMHFDSMAAIWAWRNNAGSGGTETGNGNSAPTANAGANYTIPQSTPFKLTGSGSDPDGDSLTYCWEQADLGSSTSSPTQYSTGPLVRSYNPTTSPVRFVPLLPTVIANISDNWQKLANTNRNENFRLTVRDNRSGGGNYATDSMTITVSGAQFKVNSPNGGETLSAGGQTTVTWTVGGATGNVNILLSTNGGSSYGTGGATLLLANTPNDGSEVVTLPNVVSTTCRIIVEGAGNIYYDMSNANFKTIQTTISPATMNWVVGTFKSGTVASITDSDNTYATAKPQIVARGSDQQVLEVTGNVSGSVSAMTLTTETSADKTPTTVRVDAWNYTTSSWTQLSSTACQLTDTVQNLSIPNPTQYVSGGQVKMRLRFRQTIAGRTLNFLARVDQVKWTITP